MRHPTSGRRKQVPESSRHAHPCHQMAPKRAQPRTVPLEPPPASGSLSVLGCTRVCLWGRFAPQRSPPTPDHHPVPPGQQEGVDSAELMAVDRLPQHTQQAWPTGARDCGVGVRGHTGPPSGELLGPGAHRKGGRGQDRPSTKTGQVCRDGGSAAPGRTQPTSRVKKTAVFD